MFIRISRPLSRLYLILVFIFTILLACNFGSPSISEEEEPGPNSEAFRQTQEALETLQNPGVGPGEGEGGELVLLDHGGVEFYYDPEAILDIEAATIPASEGGAYEEAHPAYIQYSLVLDSGTIAVVPVEFYESVSGAALETFPELRSLLAGKNAESLDCIPELPLVAFYHECSHQQFNADLAFVDFRSGSGVRFVTVYGVQDAAPISNENLVYTFQGITDDGQCYIRANFRLTHRALEGITEIPDEVYADADGAALAEYFSAFQQQLEDDPAGYSPALTRFDRIMSSISVAYCLGG